jgi:hypothetical protein
MAAAVPIAALFASVPFATAQEPPFWEQGESAPGSRGAARAAPRRDDALRAPDAGGGPPGGFGQQADVTGQPYDGRAPAYPNSPGYGQQPPVTYGQRYGQNSQPPAGGYGAQVPANPSYGGQGYGGPSDYRAPSYGAQADPSAPPVGGYQPDPYGGRGAQGPGGNDAYQPPRQGGGYDGGGYNSAGNDPYRQGGPPAYSPANSEPNGGYGQPYAAPADPNAGPGQPYGDDRRRWDDRRGGGGNTYSQNEVVETGHRFFGSVSQGIASAVESIFKRQGRPNGYILGEDAGGAFVAGLRYGEGVLSTKDAGTHRIYWQGPSLGYDFGGEGSKTMVLVYNLRDPSDIYTRFGGIQGAAYLIGGVSVQFQAHEGVTLAVIRSGVGLRLGANVGYLKYTRTPTWNPF